MPTTEIVSRRRNTIVTTTPTITDMVLLFVSGKVASVVTAEESAIG